jgi:hypothetical protein
VTFLVTQNLVSIVVGPFNDLKGRFASALDLIERAARCYEVKAACLRLSMAEAKRPLTASNRQYHN